MTHPDIETPLLRPAVPVGYIDQNDWPLDPPKTWDQVPDGMKDFLMHKATVKAIALHNGDVGEWVSWLMSGRRMVDGEPRIVMTSARDAWNEVKFLAALSHNNRIASRKPEEVAP